jgi:molybdopterin synthase catalytic subunit
LQLPAGSTVAAAADQIARDHPEIASFLPKVAFAVNEQYAGSKVELHEGDELALIPPVSGGSSDDWLDLLDSPLNVAQATAFVSCPQAGGIDIFLGTTRAEISAGGHELLALDYQAYESMARRQLQDLAARVRQHWPVIRLVILHRLGQVPLAEPSVLIALSTPHRAEAFDACRWIIDQLKKEVTIWKQEIWTGGDKSWVHPEAANPAQ